MTREVGLFGFMKATGGSSQGDRNDDDDGGGDVSCWMMAVGTQSESALGSLKPHSRT